METVRLPAESEGGEELKDCCRYEEAFVMVMDEKKVKEATACKEVAVSGESTEVEVVRAVRPA